jgi:hypothetical protein
VPEDHYGTIVPFHFGDTDVSRAVQTLERRLNPGMPFDSYAAWRTPDAMLRRIDEYVAAGVTKFVMRPMVSGPAFYDQCEAHGAALSHLDGLEENNRCESTIHLPVRDTTGREQEIEAILDTGFNGLLTCTRYLWVCTRKVRYGFGKGTNDQNYPGAT